LRARTVHVHRQVITGELSVLHRGEFKRLHPVDLEANARDRRGRRRDEPPDEVGPVKTAASLAFDRDFAPVVTEDGGFTDKE
jgi:hypothetical protein